MGKNPSLATGGREGGGWPTCYHTSPFPLLKLCYTFVIRRVIGLTANNPRVVVGVRKINQIPRRSVSFQLSTTSRDLHCASLSPPRSPGLVPNTHPYFSPISLLVLIPSPIPFSLPRPSRIPRYPLSLLLPYPSSSPVPISIPFCLCLSCLFSIFCHTV